MDYKIGMKVVSKLNDAGLFIRSRHIGQSGVDESDVNLDLAWKIIEQESGVTDLSEYVKIFERALDQCPDETLRGNMRGLVQECIQKHGGE